MWPRTRDIEGERSARIGPCICTPHGNVNYCCMSNDMQAHNRKNPRSHIMPYVHTHTKQLASLATSLSQVLIHRVSVWSVCNVTQRTRVHKGHSIKLHGAMRISHGYITERTKNMRKSGRLGYIMSGQTCLTLCGNQQPAATTCMHACDCVRTASQRRRAKMSPMCKHSTYTRARINYAFYYVPAQRASIVYMYSICNGCESRVFLLWLLAINDTIHS